MLSRPADSQAAAYLRLTPDAPPRRGSRGAPVGTSVRVRHLFARQPARRKFLRSPASETNALTAVVTHYALAYPEVRFSLTLDADGDPRSARRGRRALLTPGSGDLRDAVAAVYGAELAAAMLPVRSGEAPPAGHGIAVEGLASPPHISRASRGYVSLFVNRRWVQSRRLAFAVEEAYRGLLMVGRHPIAVLNLRLPPEEVDVNVHPAKSEVRFRDESAIFGALQRAVRQALMAGSPVPSTLTAPSPALSPQPTTPPLWEHARTLERRDERREAEVVARDPGPPTPALALPVLRVIGQFGSIYIVAEGPDGMYLIDQHAAHERVLYERFCRLRQSRPDGLVAPEVQGLLEPLALDLSPRQRTLLAEQGDALRDHGFEIEPFGPDESGYLLRSLPRSLASPAGGGPASGGDVRQAVLQFLDLMLEEEGGDRGDPSTGSGQAPSAPSTSSGQDRVAMSLACHGAVRAGKTLSIDEMRELVRQLEECQAPNSCPHGRPTMIQLSAETLARGFGRR